MDPFDIFMMISLIGITLLTICIITNIKHKTKIDNKIKQILNEPFIVADAQDIHHYDIFREETNKMPDNFNDDAIKDPPANKVVDYSSSEPKNKNAYKTDINFGQDKPYPSVSCSNSSIINSLKTGPMQLLPDQIECNKPNKLTAENYYKSLYNPRSIVMYNNMVKGSNYMDYTNTVAPEKLNTRILSQNTKGLIPSQTAYRNIPTGSNYAFYNTPAMGMP
jgi:hypothetical protein